MSEALFKAILRVSRKRKIVETKVICRRGERVLELHHRQSRDQLEVAEITGSYAVAEFQGRYSNQQIGKRNAHTSSLILAIDLPDPKSDRRRDRMKWQGGEQFLNKLLPLRLAFCCAGTGGTVGQFDESDNRQSDLNISRCTSNCGEHLPRVPPFAARQ